MEGSQAGPGAMLHMLVMFGMMFGVFYFLLIRPQQKKEKDRQTMIKALSKGDKLVTTGGIVGTLVGTKDEYAVIKVGDGDTKIEILKDAINYKL